MDFKTIVNMYLYLVDDLQNVNKAFIILGQTKIKCFCLFTLLDLPNLTFMFTCINQMY